MLGSEIHKILVNAPIKVNFAGLIGTTMSMQRDGWELNIEVERHSAMHGYSVRLAGKHRGLDLMMYSGAAVIDVGVMMGRRSFHSWFEGMEFPIAAQSVAKNIMMPRALPQSVSRFSVDFESPFMAEASTEKLCSLDEIFFFQSSNPDKTIYLPDNKIITMQERLDEIMGEQMEKQKEIREKKRRQSRGEGEEKTFNSNPMKEQIKLQLVAI